MGGKDVILVTGSDLAEQAMVMLQGFEVVFAGRQPTEDDLIALCERHNPVAILVRYGRITAKVMDAAPALQVISKHGSGIDVIDQTAAAERNIAVRAAPGANAAAVAEHTWALILACAKSVVPLDKRLRDGHWDKATHKSIELEGLTLGLIGLGAIGSRVATIGHAFGMKVLAYDPYAKSLPALCERAETLTGLLSESPRII
ncbi:3-phosphoglycerate dehydrogenase, partial [Enterobacter roggenkampii]|uniref:NAD(P)-dependent oxidoreductase n=1 Tax=Enterobacter roggenkampii TaxID=1812935 RepID=UPI0023DEAC80